MSADNEKQFWQFWNHLKNIHDSQAGHHARELLCNSGKQFVDKDVLMMMIKHTHTWM